MPFYNYERCEDSYISLDDFSVFFSGGSLNLFTFKLDFSLFRTKWILVFHISRVPVLSFFVYLSKESFCVNFF